MGEVGHDPAFAPLGLLLFRPQFGEEEEGLEAGGQVLLPVGPSGGCNVNRVLLEVSDRTPIVGKGPMDIDVTPRPTAEDPDDIGL